MLYRKKGLPVAAPSSHLSLAALNQWLLAELVHGVVLAARLEGSFTGEVARAIERHDPRLVSVVEAGEWRVRERELVVFDMAQTLDEVRALVPAIKASIA